MWDVNPDVLSVDERFYSPGIINDSTFKLHHIGFRDEHDMDALINMNMY